MKSSIWDQIKQNITNMTKEKDKYDNVNFEDLKQMDMEEL